MSTVWAALYVKIQGCPVFIILGGKSMLEKNSYPGRGIIVGKSADGNKSVVAYFIMGRSTNSRNRVFEATADGIRTRAFDESKMEDPSLIIYHPVRALGRGLIVTNGDQTDTIREYLEKGMSFEQSLRTREFEPDSPNWTPRISALLSPDGSYKMSILKSADAEGTACVRNTFEYPGIAGKAHYIHTYKCDGDPIPSFEGEPEALVLDNCTDIDAFANSLWAELDADNKVSLYVCFRNNESGEESIRIINKNV